MQTLWWGGGGPRTYRKIVFLTEKLRTPLHKVFSCVVAKLKINSVALVRKPVLTERSPLVGEI
jgi:hypothetical protein